MADCMDFPKDYKKFLKDYSFEDKKEVYTNGAELIPVFRVEQMLEHYFVPGYKFILTVMRGDIPICKELENELNELRACCGHVNSEERAAIEESVAKRIFAEINEVVFAPRIESFQDVCFHASLGFDKELYNNADSMISNLTMYKREIQEIIKKYEVKSND